VKFRKRHFIPLIPLIILILAVFMGSLRWSVSPQNLPVSPSTTQLGGAFRVATWNIHGGADASLDHISSYLKNFDLVALNEIHANFTPQSDTLANLLGNQSTFAPSEWRWYHPHLGNALIHGSNPKEAFVAPLPSSMGRGKRSILSARFSTSNGALNVMVVHIDRQTDRKNQIQIVADSFSSLPVPSILMGDFNSSPKDPLMGLIIQIPGIVDVVQEHLADKDPADRIDYIFIRGLSCSNAGVTPNNASDHPLVWANLTIPE
jgi:endonuclease/exonuclease/phosphatase family metal-dependent hydrolase